MYEKLKEHRRCYLNDKLWTKFSSNFEYNTKKDFTYIDLQRLHYHSDKETMASLNKAYSDLLLSYKANYTVFFDKLHIKYKERVIAFSKTRPRQSFFIKKDERVSIMNYSLLNIKPLKHVLVSETGETIDSVSDYLIRHENPSIYLAIHIKVL